MNYRVLTLLFVACIAFIIQACRLNSESSNAKIFDQIIIDVRTEEEWTKSGHASCSVNYPLDQLEEKIPELKKYKHIILVCRSGKRAEKAKAMLKKAGIKKVENKGAWQNISCGD